MKAVPSLSLASPKAPAAGLKMHKGKKKRHQSLVAAISKIIEDGDAHEVMVFEGSSWAALSQPAWCAKLGFSDRTLRALAKIPPIVSTKTANEHGKPLVLYRVAAQPHKSARHLANIMAKLYRQKYGLDRVSRRNWGCLVGLAQVWPDGVEVDIFETVLNDVSAFVCAVKMLDPDNSNAQNYYEWLPISLVRKFWKVALQIYVDQIQWEGKVPHPSIVAMYPNLWPAIAKVG